MYGFKLHVVKSTEKAKSHNFVIDYYTILDFFLQIVIDISEKMLIINIVERKTLQAYKTKTGMV